MARIAGVNVPTNKRVHIALTYVHGIGLTGSKKICKTIGIGEERRINNLSEDELTKIREIIDKDFLVEGDLRRKTSMDIKRYLEYQPDDKSGNELLALLEPTIELKNTEELKAVLPPSKSIDDLNLDPETKKKVEESTVFVNNDLTMDVSKGAGKEINESLDFFKHIKGIDIKKIVFDLKTFQTMDETLPPYTDVNGSWHVKFGHTIMKCLSEQNLEKELDELLKLNNIPKGSAKVNLRQEHVMPVQEPITFYKGNGFIIDVPPMQGTYKLIVIKKDE